MRQNLPATLLCIVFSQVTEYAAGGENGSGGGSVASGDQAAYIHRHVALPQKHDIVAGSYVSVPSSYGWVRFPAELCQSGDL
jgi:hypothetical protein